MWKGPYRSAVAVAMAVGLFALIGPGTGSSASAAPVAGATAIQRTISSGRVVDLRAAAATRDSGFHPVVAAPVITHRAAATGGWPGAAAAPLPRGMPMSGGGAEAGPRSPHLVATSATPEVLTKFPAASISSDVALFGSDQSVTPPDTQLAVGPSQVVEAVNNTLEVWSRAGVSLKTFDLNSNGTHALFPVQNGYGFTDPRVVYDAGSDRWYVSGWALNGSNDSQVFLAVSTTGDATAGYFVLALPIQAGVLQDQPKLGFDAGTLVLSWSDSNGSSFTGQETWVFSKADMLAQATVHVAVFPTDPDRFDIVPVQSPAGAGTEYAVYNNSCGGNTSGGCLGGVSSIGVFKINGVPPSLVTASGEARPTITPTTAPPRADQPGAAASIDTDDDRYTTAISDGSTLYVSGNDTCTPTGDSTPRACSRLTEVSITSTPAVTADRDFGIAMGGLYYPAAAADAAGNVFIAATFSSTTIPAEAIGLTLPAGSSSFVGSVFQAGTGAYGYTGCGTGMPSCRWGDYSGVAVDPNNPADVWVAAEYTPAAGNVWGTAIGELTVAPPSVTGLTPNSGSTLGGTHVTIHGFDFTAASTVTFGGMAASMVTVVSPTQINAVSPAGAAGTVVDVAVTTGDGSNGASASDHFTYITPPAVAAVTPPTGATVGGAIVTITGSNFSGATGVTFGGAAATNVAVLDAGTIQATSPAGAAGTADVVVTTGGGPSATVAADHFLYVVPAAGSYQAVQPTRICDTRAVQAGVAANQCNPNGTDHALAQGATLTIDVCNGAGAGCTLSAVAINVTVTGNTASSYLTAYPAGQGRPNASNLNFTAGDTVANLVEVKVGTNGMVTFYNNSGQVDLIVDLEGLVAGGGASSGSPGLYNPVPPQRICDTRQSLPDGFVVVNQCNNGGAGGTLGGGSVINVPVAGKGGIPASGVSAVVINLTATDTSANGYLTAWPTDNPRPTASNVNWTAGHTVPNRVIVPVGHSGEVSIYNFSGAADVVIDVNGWYGDGTEPPPPGATFTGISPTRICDTRADQPGVLTNECNNGGAGAAMGPQQSMDVQVTSSTGAVPIGAKGVVVNVTVTGTSTAGYLTVYPADDVVQPFISDVNWNAGETVPNLVAVKLSSAGQVIVFNSSGRTDVIIDVVGYYT